MKSSNDPHDPSGRLLIGKIIGVHGVRGDVKILSHAESCATFAPGLSLLIGTPDSKETLYSVRRAKPHKRSVLLSLEGVENRDDAEHLVGADLYLFKEQLPKLEEGAWYWFQIIGLDVHTLEGACLGRVTSILPTGGNDVYVVQSPEGDREVLIPALQRVVREIDLDRNIMRVELPDGLIESQGET